MSDAAPPIDRQALAVVDAALARHAGIPGTLLEILHDIQDAIGWIPAAIVPRVAAALALSRAEVHGVVSFYHDFRSAPPGQVIVQLCRAEACQAVGARRLERELCEYLAIGFGETTSDGRYSLEPVYCLGNCACGPSLRIGDAIHGRVGPEGLRRLLPRNPEP